MQAKPGTEHGPAALREGGLIKKLMALGLDVHDYGDVGTPSHEDDHDFDLPVKNPKHVATASGNVSSFCLLTYTSSARLTENVSSF